MHLALLSKAIREAGWMLLGCCALMYAFHWIFVWLVKLVPEVPFQDILLGLPPAFQNLLGIPVRVAVTPEGRISLAYAEPVVLFLSAAWGVGRGSDVVAGELGRGTMEMLLAQPVRRWALLASQGAVAVAGAAAMSACAVAGTATGLALVAFDREIPLSPYLPEAVNLFALTCCTYGLSVLASSWDRYRWRAIGLVSAVYVVQLIVKLVARVAPHLDWLNWFTFHAAYVPQVLANRPDEAWSLSLRYDGLLLGLGAAAFLIGAVIFCRRDLPAPL
jgi:ABC-2 type transport system permease protein